MSDKTGSEQLKAYEVHEPCEGHGCIVFATNSATARRKGANELDTDWEGVDRCRRAQWADEYAPGPVPPLAMIEQGWWMNCMYCDQTVSGDSFDEGDGGEVIKHQPVAVGQYVFCCAEHAARFDAERRLRRAAEAALVELAMTKWPGVHVGGCHVYDYRLLPRNERGDALASVWFTFPGGKHPVDFAFGDDTVHVYRSDVDAWHAFVDKKGGTAC